MITQRPRVHIVVTCANRKRHPVAEQLRLRHVTGVRTQTRIDHWTRRLNSPSVETVRAEDLYAGEHWDISRKLTSYATGFAQATLWVASAGWGLIPAHAKIRPYSATFAPGQADSVPPGHDGTRAWWNAVAAWSGPGTATPRSLTELVAEHPRDRILLVLSQPYLAACADDLADAQTVARDSQISIVAAGVRGNHKFAAWQLPANARLQHSLGGTRGALNVRIAAAVLRAELTDHNAMRDRLKEMLAAAPPLIVYGRRPLADEDVRAFIRAELAANTKVSRTALLRKLRDLGMACEQRRFADIYDTAMGVQA